MSLFLGIVCRLASYGAGLLSWCLRFVRHKPNGAEKVQLTAGSWQLKPFALSLVSICKQRCHLSQTSTLTQAKQAKAKAENRKARTENRKPKTKTKSVARFVSIINDKFGKIRINMRGKLN